MNEQTVAVDEGCREWAEGEDSAGTQTQVRSAGGHSECVPFALRDQRDTPPEGSGWGKRPDGSAHNPGLRSRRGCVPRLPTFRYRPVAVAPRVKSVGERKAGASECREHSRRCGGAVVRWVGGCIESCGVTALGAALSTELGESSELDVDETNPYHSSTAFLSAFMRRMAWQRKPIQPHRPEVQLIV